MKRYLISITMPDGSRGRHSGLYADGFDAVITALDNFPDAKRISAMRVTS
ncbi:hypothetical protein [Variovorax sp. PAMC26660]|nr:hypothetical protein [Variovorax sp. PAMC26660]QNK69218.1 hypothetical protein H7F35_05770 [Variovorax sp. PAMC26660]